MITAQLANHIANSNNTSAYNSLLDLVEKRITQTSLSGNFQVSINYSETNQTISYEVSKKLADYLASLGYSTTYTKAYITIKWS